MCVCQIFLSVVVPYVWFLVSGKLSRSCAGISISGAIGRARIDMHVHCDTCIYVRIHVHIHSHMHAYVYVYVRVRVYTRHIANFSLNAL
jgi:hypothetical protein